MIVTDDRVAAFAAQHLGDFAPPFTCLGLEERGQIATAVVFNHYEGTDIHMTVAGSRWTRPLLRAVGQYVFGQLGCIRMTAVTEQPAVVRLALRCGGQIEGRLRNHFGRGSDGIVLGFLKEEWKHGIEAQSP